MNKILKIQIIGETSSGKTSVARFLQKALIEAGINIIYDDDGVSDEPGVPLSYLKGHTVEIKTIQINRSPVSDIESNPFHEMGVESDRIEVLHEEMLSKHREARRRVRPDEYRENV